MLFRAFVKHHCHQEAPSDLLASKIGWVASKGPESVRMVSEAWEVGNSPLGPPACACPCMYGTPAGLQCRIIGLVEQSEGNHCTVTGLWGSSLPYWPTPESSDHAVRPHVSEEYDDSYHCAQYKENKRRACGLITELVAAGCSNSRVSPFTTLLRVEYARTSWGSKRRCCLLETNQSE